MKNIEDLAYYYKQQPPSPVKLASPVVIKED